MKCKDCRDYNLCLHEANVHDQSFDPEYDKALCFKPLTNADHIRAMSDEELAHLLTFNIPDCINYCEDARCGCKWSCKHGEGLLAIKDWLKQPYKEDK